jgi:multicomponent Na+:H+ antiporter subunit D
MVAVPAVLLIAAAVVGFVPDGVPAVERAAARFVGHRGYAAWALHGTRINWPKVTPGHVAPIDIVTGLLAVGCAFGAAGLGLFGRPVREALPRAVADPARDAIRALRGLQSGLIGDYIAWWAAGASLLGIACLLILI